MKNKFLVSVRCISYNHASYIEDCMNGFTMQETNFPYVCVIDDDASTDGEPEVITNYLAEHFNIDDKVVVRNEETGDYRMIFAQHKTNKNCFFAVYFLKYNHYSIRKSREDYVARFVDGTKYMAICEGDDYWTDSLKLKKQIRFLEAHSDYSMCFHRAQILKEYEYKVGLKCNDIDDREYNPNELFKKWKVPTASIVAKHEVLDVQNVGSERILNGDIVFVLNCAKIGKIRGMSDIMSVYRVQGSGVTYDPQAQYYRKKKYPEHFLFIKDNYPFLKKYLVNRAIARAYLNRRKVQQTKKAYIKDFLLAFYYNPVFFIDKIDYLRNKGR